MIGTTVSHYKIIEKLGEGGMGIVYRAHDTKLDRAVALKFLPPEMTTDEVAKRHFIREAQAASALDHPNIAVVHEVDESKDGRSFICMAYYSGETLKEKITRGQLRVSEAIDIALQIAQGLQRAHGASIVHRDIKPANIIVTEEGVVKILDFGLAKLSGDTLSSKSGRMAGTAAYMSPEQVSGMGADRRSDLFSLGVVLYEMVTGRRPFEAEHEAAIFYSIVHLDPTPVSKGRSDIPAGLDRVIDQLLQKDPARRYQSAAEVVADLTIIQMGLRPPSATWARDVLRAARSRRWSIPAAVTAFALICVIGWLIMSRHRSFEFEPSRYVLVADFENQTSHNFFDNSLTEAVRYALRQSPHMNLLPRDRIPEALRRMELPPDHRLDEPTALALARREGVQVLVAGGINQIGASYTLSCRIIDAASGEELHLLRRNAARVENVLTELDELCKDIRNKLGESLQQITTSTKPLEEVTTPSLQALELHSRAMHLEGQGNYRDAAVLERQALAEDSMFAIAVSELSYIYRKIGNDSLAMVYHRRVLPLINRVTDREKYYILSIYYGPSFELDFPMAVENVRQLVLRYPNSAEGFSILGWLAMYEGNRASAVEAFQRSLALDSTHYAVGSIFNNWGFTLALDGDGSAALPFFKRSKSIRPSYYTTDLYIAQANWMIGELDSAEQILRGIPPSADGWQQISTRMALASLYEFEGRLQAAREQCADAIEMCRKEDRSSDEAYFHYMLGELAAASSDWGAYLTELKESERRSRSPYLELPLIGASYARNGRPGDSRRILSEIESARSDDPYFLKRRKDYLHLVDGEIKLQRRLPAEALDEFRNVGRLYCGDPVYLLAQRGLARAAELQGDTNAITLYQGLLKRRGEAVMAFVRSLRPSGLWTRQLWPEVDFVLGKLYVQRQDTVLAEQHLQRCLESWSHADRVDQQAREAAKILLQLTKRK